MSKFLKVVKTAANGNNSDCYINVDNITYIHDLKDMRKIYLSSRDEITTLMDMDYLLSMSQS